jgi:membrane protease YdiL (CAAX protease family)
VPDDSAIGPTKALVVELALVCLIVCYGAFSLFRLVVLLLIATQSLWVRRLRWADVGLRRPASFANAAVLAGVATIAIILAVPYLIVPTAVGLTGVPIDLTALNQPGDATALGLLLGQTWTLAAFGEEMVFRGYLMRRFGDLVGDTLAARVGVVAATSILFGLAHRYQGWAGVLATATIGCLLAILFLASKRNLWPAIMCHGLVDTVVLSAIYADRQAWFFG